MSKTLKLRARWVEHLCIPIRNGANAHTLLGFNRFRYRGVPKIHEIKQGNVELLARAQKCSSQLLDGKMLHRRLKVI